MSNIHPERPGSTVPVAFMLLVSGGCALVFQVVWIRELRLVFGATTASSAAVLAIFMAGLGLGNGLLGRRIDNSLRPLRFYAFLEAGIALSAGLSPVLIDVARHFYIGIGGQTTLGPGLATVIRLMAAAAILAVPTFLMGGTMPAAARVVSIESDVKRLGVAMLYGLNTFGAVVGAGLANFVLLESMGNRAVLWSACLVNLLLAAVALVLSKRLCNYSKRKGAERRKGEVSQPTPEKTGQLALVCISAGIVGFVFFLMEIVWYRMLGPLLGGTTYTFGLILCIALLGIGLGGALYNIVGRWVKPTSQLLSLTCALEALLIAIPFWYGDRIAIWVLYQQSETIASFGDQIWNWFQIGAFVILPASFVAGFQFPLLIAIAGTGRRDVAKHVGWTFASNTVGAISGSLAGGFFLLPIATAPGVWKIAVFTLVALGIAVAALGNRWKHPLVATSATFSILAIMAIVGEGPTAVWRHSGIGAGRAKLEGSGRNAVQDFAIATRRQCIWETDGVESSVAITATDSLSFIVNGKNDGNAYTDAGTQIGFPLVGPLLHGPVKTCLVIGLGTGESSGWLADLPDTRVVDTVEMEPSVVEMAERCAAVNRNMLKNPKSQLHFNDAREFLLTSKKEYDLIASEPSNPYRAGIANLYTREFYESVSNRLTADGLFLQWLQGYEVDDHTVRIVLHTLRSVFPHVQVWRARARDMFLVCSNSAFVYDAASISAQMNQANLKRGLNLAWRVDDIEGILAHFVCGEQTIDRFLLSEQRIPLNTDDRNLLEYAFAKSVGQPTRFSVQDLHLLAKVMHDDLPVPTDQIDPAALTQRRLALHLYLGEAIPNDAFLAMDQRVMAEAYTLYLAKRYSDAAQQFKKVDVDLTCPIGLVVYAHTLAEVGAAIPDHIMEALKANNETEAAAVAAISRLQQGERSQGLEGVLTTFDLLQTNPWGSPHVLDSILRYATTIAEADAVAALRIFKKLNGPFSMYRLEDKRILVRYVVSENLERKYTVEAIAALEPHVPWKGWFLENRARVYAAEQHPLSNKANSDLERYQKWSVRSN